MLNSEASYRVVIDEETIDIVAADNCSEEICTYAYYPESRFTTPPPVAVDIVGCTTVRISPMNISSCKCVSLVCLSKEDTVILYCSLFT